MEKTNEQRPNPISKAAESSHLPRDIRSRLGQTTDEIPEGKKLAVGPVHHHNAIDPPNHDPARLHPKTALELGVAPEELRKMQKKDKDKVILYAHDVQHGMDWQGTSTQANKQMSSVHRHAGQIPSGKTISHKHNKQ